MFKFKLGFCLIVAVACLSSIVCADSPAVDPALASGARLAWADTVCAGKIVSIDALNTNVGATGGVLYKSENIHGGRGPTFLVQNPAEQTGKRILEIRNARCEVISSFGMYATDEPYGARYYQETGGAGHSAEELSALARQAGSNNFLVEGLNKWILVHNPFDRDGNIRK